MFSPNDILLDQTMLYEASRLLEDCPQGGAFIDYLDLYKRHDNNCRKISPNKSSDETCSLAENICSEP